MKRKNFFKVLGVGTLGTIVSCREANTESNSAEPVKKALMNVGCQSGGASVENFEFKARHGVYHLDPGSPKMIEGVGWDLDDSLEIVETADKYGISIDAYHLPLASSGIDRVATPNIMLGKSPERDKEIEMIQQMIEVAGKSGVHTLLYNMTIHPVLRTGRTVDPDRGNSSYSTWNLEEAIEQGMHEEKTIAGDVSIDDLYERITYFLERVIPVAEEYNVKLGNHIADPPTPIGYGGITRWNSPDIFEGIKRYSELSDSECHGFNLCVGSVAEGLEDPKNEIVPIVKWIGERDQIFNVHLRNIKGGWGNFQEVYPDNGDMDFVEVMRALRDVGYSGMVMPDHIPKHPDPESSKQGFAFAYGYIKALIQMLQNEERV